MIEIGRLYKSTVHKELQFIRKDNSERQEEILRIELGDIAMILNTGYKSRTGMDLIRVLLRGRVGFIYEVHLKDWDCLC